MHNIECVKTPSHPLRPGCSGGLNGSLLINLVDDFFELSSPIAIDHLEHSAQPQHRVYGLSLLAVNVDTNALEQHVVVVVVHGKVVPLLAWQHDLFVD